MIRTPLTAHPNLDVLGELKLPAALLRELRAYLETSFGGEALPGLAVAPLLGARPGCVVTQPAEHWMSSPFLPLELLELERLRLRSPTVLSCRQVPLHTDVPAGQQVLLYWVLQNTGFDFWTQGRAYSFKPGALFCFDPGLPHQMTPSQGNPQGVGTWTGWAVPLEPRSYQAWKSQRLACTAVANA